MLSLKTKHKHNSTASFTLVELLIVIAILAVLAAAIVLVINPAELLGQARDSSRVTSLSSLERAIGMFSLEASGVPRGVSNVVHISLPDTLPNCASHTLPGLPSGWTYRCVTAENLRRIDGQGWIPINFTILAGGSPLATLPIDPVNNATHYFAYVTGASYALTAMMESERFLQSNANRDGGTDPARIEAGTSRALWARATGLVGYWSFDEGSGTTARDLSDSGAHLAIGGVGATVSWGAGKIGSAIEMLPSAKTATTPCPTGVSNAGTLPSSIRNLPQSVFTLVGWYRFSAGPAIMRFATQHGNVNFNGFWMYTGSIDVANSLSQNTGLAFAFPADNQWRMFTYTFNRPGSTHRVYLDGRLAASASNLSGDYGNINRLHFGHYDTHWCGAGHAMTGFIDEVRMYNRILSDAEIEAIFNATK